LINYVMVWGSRSKQRKKRKEKDSSVENI